MLILHKGFPLFSAQLLLTPQRRYGARQTDFTLNTLLMNRFLLCSFATFAALTAYADWAPTAFPWIEGEGTPSSPYLVSEADHLRGIAREVADGQTFLNAQFNLINDIDCGGGELPAIGLLDKYTTTEGAFDYSLYFLGVFCGQGHTIDNFTLTDAHVPAENKESVGGTGLFACSGPETWISGLIIGPNAVITGDLVTGAFIGQMNGGQLTDCMMLGTVNATDFSGALVGCMEDGRVTGCVNKGTVNGRLDLGAIVGQQSGTSTVLLCYNTGAVTSSTIGGAGITGTMYDRSGVYNCYNTGAVSGQANPYLGEPDGLCSDKSFGCFISDCYNVPELSGVATRYGEDITPDALRDMPEGLVVSEPDPGLDGLGSGRFVADIYGLNDGFPVLEWQNTLYERNAHAAAVPAGSASASLYDLTGRPLAAPAPGTLVIEVSDDGTARKYIAR